ncbi:hypothetical protein PGTUg99_029506 [Puccinia graminis f. sp. tritici]|uniref:Uncharacterized protein n=1 Tax=Puccinia graminis f. sp. tritici TaxID=56615 RepID=A0A5B0RYR6_PUCGR|nr:hypothetical protein PGTUg99_029506 [Puccinia graminis f. sp. tritici]
MDHNTNLDPLLRTGSSDTETPPTPVASSFPSESTTTQTASSNVAPTLKQTNHRGNGNNRKKRNTEETEAHWKEEARRKKIREVEKGQSNAALSGTKHCGRGTSQANPVSKRQLAHTTNNTDFAPRKSGNLDGGK